MGREPCTFTLELAGPVDVAASVERFRRWGDDLLDRWDGATFVRVAHAGSRAVPYAATVSGTVAAPRLRIAINDAGDRVLVERAVREMFGATPAAALSELEQRDPAIARLAVAYPGIRPIIQADGFTAIVRSISAQQVNLAWAATTRRRLAGRYGERLAVGAFDVYALAPERLAVARIEDLRALQFTTRKAEYLIALARSIVQGTFDPHALAALPDAAAIERLVALRGIGLWTAEWYLARTLDRPVVVAGDLGVRKAVGLVYRAGALPSERETRELTAHWGAAASLAQELALYALAATQSAKPFRRAAPLLNKQIGGASSNDGIDESIQSQPGRESGSSRLRN